jgi:asparagine synthase (glutamine-hydrolysing)
MDEAAARVEALLQDSVRLRLIADVPVGSLLSGGIDSSVVSAIAARARANGRLATFSLAVPDRPDVDESPWARRVAGDLRTDHADVALRARDVELYPRILALFGEPFAVSSILGVYLLARAAAGRVKILLSGDGGDELFAGYVQRQLGVDARWDGYGRGLFARLRAERAVAASAHVRWRDIDRHEMRRLRLRSLVTPDRAGRDFEFNLRRCMFNDHEKAALYTAAWRDGHDLRDTVPWLCESLPAAPMDRLARRRLHDVRTSLHNEMLAKLDRATMAWGIEGRVPLLDHRVAELAFALPADLHRAGGGKGVLRAVARRWVAADVASRPKQGFDIPLGSWFGGALRGWVRDVLDPAAIRRAGIFEPAVVAEVLAAFERRPNVHRAHWVFTLCAFQLWHDARAAAGCTGPGPEVLPPRSASP